MSSSEFKHDINKVIEECAEALQKKMDFNPLQVLRNFHLFSMHFFENTPRVPLEEIENWYYLRDSGTHSAVIFNYETKELRLVDPESYWDKDTIKFFQKSEEELKADYKKYEKRINTIKRTLAYRKLKPVIKWYFTCPLPFITVYGEKSAHDFILNVLKKYHAQFDTNSKDYEILTRDLFDAYFFDKELTEREKDFIVVSVRTFRKEQEYIGAESFRTPEDVLEFFIKHNRNKISTIYNEERNKYTIKVIEE